MTVDHKEKEFERSIVQHLVEHGGYVEGDPADFDSHLALDKSSTLSFIKNSQPKAWEKLSSIHQAKVEENFIKRLCRELDSHGMLHVLRHGITDYGVNLKLMYSAPETSLNPESVELYNKNILTVTRQVHHSGRHPEQQVDLVFFVNGLPVATAELKTEFTGQTYKNAIKQYRYDRDTRDEIFQFKKRAIVHFAVDTDEVWMTTRLQGDKTVFLPFNRGHDNAAGNPPNPGGYKSAYLWEYVLMRDSWIDILARFLHHQVEKKDGKTVDEHIIFPRYHQLDVVRKIQGDVKEKGVGRSYLIQHSAGSGKSNSIAWLAYRLSTLHDQNDNIIFDSVVVVTDRRVLDQQLQETIYQFEHKTGVVEPIDRHSGQLAKALESGVKVIITTLQKFPFVTEKIEKLPDRNYAIIVDEAHSSQTGETAKEMKAILSQSLEEAEIEALKEEESNPDFQDELIRSMKARGKHTNLSFFAFTATPKYETLEMFGNTGEDGKPQPFHLYSMRQAIQEGFILDVLQNYTTYKTFFRLAKRIEEDPELDKRKATSAIMKYISGHPHNIAEKTKVMVEHFAHTTSRLLNYKAKAMVVTASRLHAVRYFLEFRRYIKERGLEGIVKPLVAFSGRIKDGGIEYSENMLNGFGDREIPEKFDTDEYNLIIVAFKFQTGFDQPLLHTMYVDQKLMGLRAVQTLSRLNRIYPGKEETFILDFVNSLDDIREAFEPYYVCTAIDEPTDPNRLYDLRTELDAYQIYWPQEIDNFAKVFFKNKEKQTVRDQGMLHSYVDPAVERYTQKAEEEKESFKARLSGFLRLYRYASNIMPFSDVDLEKLYVYGRFLLKKLPKKRDEEKVYVDDDISLEYYRLKKMKEKETIYLTGDESEITSGIHVGEGKGIQDEKARLSEIIETINDIFGIDFRESEKLFFEQIAEDLSTSNTIKSQAENNTRENFKYGVIDAALDGVISRMEKNEKIAKAFIDNEQFREYIIDNLIVPELYKRFHIEGERG